MKSLNAAIHNRLAPSPVGGVSAKVANTSCPITMFLCKTNPIYHGEAQRRRIASIAITKRYAKSTFLSKANSNPKQSQSNPIFTRRSRKRRRANPKQTQFKPKIIPFGQSGKFILLMRIEHHESRLSLKTKYRGAKSFF